MQGHSLLLLGNSMNVFLKSHRKRSMKKNAWQEITNKQEPLKPLNELVIYTLFISSGYQLLTHVVFVLLFTLLRKIRINKANFNFCRHSSVEQALS